MAIIDGNVNLDNAVLSVATFAPLGGAAVLGLLPKKEEFLVKAWALGTSVFTLLCGLYLVLRFNYADAGAPQFERTHSWINVINSNYHVFMDGISLPLFLLSMVVTTLCIVYSWDHFPEPRNPKAFLMLLLVLETGMLGSFVAEDLILFFVFFELVLLPMYFLIGVWGGENRQYASLKFFLFTLFGSALMILSFLALYFKSGGAGLEPTFDIPMLIERGMSGTLVRSTELLIFGGLFMGFAIKVPMFPFHTWLPDAHTQAPTAGSVILAGVMLKLGTYGLLRYCVFLFPEAADWAGPVLVTLAVIGITYGAVVAAVQKDLKRLVAYTSVSHFGFIVLGIFAMTSQAQAGSALYMFNHGLSTAALFLVTGFLISRRGSKMIDDYGGVEKVAPVLAGTFLVAGLSSLSLPGLSPFVSEFLVLAGTFTVSVTAAVFATLGIVLAALYILYMYQRTMTGPIRESTRNLPDLGLRESAALAPLLALIVVLGFFPKPALDAVNPTVDRLLAQVGAGDPEPTVASDQEGTSK